MSFESRELLEAQYANRQPKPEDEDLDMELTKLIYWSRRMEDDTDDFCRHLAIGLPDSSGRRECMYCGKAWTWL
jgi:hypothetical protein